MNKKKDNSAHGMAVFDFMFFLVLTKKLLPECLDKLV